jgi:uncharacterized repeat protein (TIGR01451 family)
MSIRTSIFATLKFAFGLVLLCEVANAQPAGFVRLDSPTCCAATRLLAADVNGDTRVDLIAAGTGFSADRTISVFSGTGAGRFTTPARYFIGLTGDPFDNPDIRDIFTGDVDGDGRVDIVATLYPQSHIAVLLGQAGGTFSAPIRKFLPYIDVAGAGDLNGDGRLDLVVNDNVSRQLRFRVLLGRPDGSFAVSSTEPPAPQPDDHIDLQAIGLADMDGDSATDLVFYEHVDAYSGGGTRQLRIVRGNGDGTFQLTHSTVIPAPPGLNGEMVIVDINNDRARDIVASDRGVMVHYNLGSTFLSTMFLEGRNTTELAVGDLNLDGWPDILSYVSSEHDWEIIPSIGLGLFASPNRYPLGADTVAALEDFNRDGRLDVAIVNWTTSGLTTLLNHPPDLIINKTEVGDFFAGGTGNYALHVRNLGLGSTPETGGVTVRDVLPPSLTYVSATSPGWTCGVDGPELECRRLTPIAAGEETKIALTVGIAATAPAEISNTATVSSNGDYNPANDTSSSAARVRRPNLALTKTAEESVFWVGAVQTYTLTVTNVGDADADLFGQRAVVFDPLTRGFLLESVGGGCEQLGLDVRCEITGPMHPGDTAVFHFQVRTLFTVGGTLVVNRARVSHPADIDPSNDSASVSRFVQVEPALAINLLQSNVLLVPTNSGNKMSMSSSLDAALAALKRQQPGVAVKQLETFQQKVSTFGKTGQIDEKNSADLIAGAQITMAAINEKTKLIPKVQ